MRQRPQPGRLCYIGAVVLGLDDALLEFTGALAGFTVALGDARTIALAGITTGVAATVSMDASEFLSQETAANGKDPWTAALATGLAYLLTVALLLLPYFLFVKPYLALRVSFFFAGAIILCFTWIVARLKRINLGAIFCACSQSVSASRSCATRSGKIWRPGMGEKLKAGMSGRKS